LQQSKASQTLCLNGTARKSFKSAWRMICRAVDLEDFHYHDLRHTFSSNLLLSGGNLKDMKEMIGHNDLAMTDRYTRLADSHKRRLQKNLAKHYGYK
jgi:site-specific recombinase XerD